MPVVVTPLNLLMHQQSTRRDMTIHETHKHTFLKKMVKHETHKHHFQVADLGDTDNDQDRSIVPSIDSILNNEGLECVVDGDEMNPASFTVWTYSDRDTIQEILQKNEIDLED